MNLKKIIASLTAAALTCCMTAAFAGVQAQEEKLRVMPLGDSITDGFNIVGGYRTPLWKMLEANGLADGIDFVGPNWGGDGDPNHAGYSGYAIADIPGQRQGIYNFIDYLMENFPADVVMLQIGTNDILSSCNEGMADRLELLVDSILTYIPEDGLLYVATIPYMDADVTNYTDAYTVEEMDAAVDAYNNDVKKLVAKKRSADNRIALSDINSVLTKADLADGVHPSQEGYNKMAAYWYDKLTEYLDMPEVVPTEVYIESELVLESKPKKTAYLPGEPLDLTGLSISLNAYYNGSDSPEKYYSWESPLDHPDAFIVNTSAFDSNTLGTYPITVKCTDALIDEYNVTVPEVSFEVTVQQELPTPEPTEWIPPEPVEGAYGYLNLAMYPDKTTYEAGFKLEDLDFTGLEVAVDYSYTFVAPEGNTIYADTKAYPYSSPFDYPEVYTVDTSAVREEPGIYPVTIRVSEEVAERYNVGNTASFNITVLDEIGIISGDTYHDGEISILDVITLQKFLLGAGSLNTPYPDVADLNGDRQVDVFDLAYLKKAVLNQ